MKRHFPENSRMNDNQQIDILFVVSPTNAREPYMPFYYLYLARYLEKHGFTVEMYMAVEKCGGWRANSAA